MIPSAPFSFARAELERTADIAEHNATYYVNLGAEAQADLCRAVAADCRAAIERLQSDRSIPDN